MRECGDRVNPCNFISPCVHCRSILAGNIPLMDDVPCPHSTTDRSCFSGVDTRRETGEGLRDVIGRASLPLQTVDALELRVHGLGGASRVA